MNFNPLFVPIGLFVLFAGVLPWYANPLWVLGLVFGALRKRIPAVLCGILSLPMAAFFRGAKP